MSCVNTKSKEFIETAKRLDLSSGTLELIVHEFQNTEGNEEGFPSDAYILERVRGESMTNASLYQVKLWNSKYSKPITANTLDAARRIASDAARCFPKQSIKVHGTYDGKYKVIVARPKRGTSGIMYQKQKSERQRNLSTVIDFYSEVIKKGPAKARFEEEVAEVTRDYQRRMYFRTNQYKTEEGLKKRMELITAKIRDKFGPILSKVYYIKVGSGYRVQLDFVSFDTIIERKLQDIYRWDDDALASEALRIKQEAALNEMYYINKKKYPNPKEQIMKKNPYTFEWEIEEALEFLDNLENDPELNRFVDDAIRWLKNGTISLPRNAEMVMGYFKKAREFGIDTQKAKSPFDIIKAIQDKEKDKITEGETLDYNNIPELHFVRRATTADGKVVDIYNVDNTEEGQRAVVNIIARTSPKLKTGRPLLESSWCLSQYNWSATTLESTPSAGAKNMWHHYNTVQKQIAIYNGVPVAFNASALHRDQWWDLEDTPHNSIEEVSTKLYNKKVMETPHNGGGFSTIHLGNFSYTLYDDVLTTIEQRYHVDNVTIIKSRKVPEDEYGGNITMYNTGRDNLDFHGYNTYNPNMHINTRYGKLAIRCRKNGGKEYWSYDVSVPSVFGAPDEIPSKDNNIPDNIKEFFHKVEALALSDAYRKVPASLLQEAATLASEFIEAKHEEYKEDLAKLKEQEKARLEEAKARLEAARAKRQQNSTQEEFNWDAYDTVETTVAANRINETIPNEYATEQENDNEYAEEIEQDDLIALGTTINEYNEYEEEVEPSTIVETMRAFKEGKIEQMYNERVKQPFNKELSGILHDILKKYHFEVLEGPIQEVFGEDTLGALDIIQKIVYLALEKDRNAITDAEEFSHAFIELMGSAYRKNLDKYPEAKTYSTLRDMVEKTSLYQQTFEDYKTVYTYNNGKPDIPTIKKEALGKALAAVLTDRYEVKTEADKSFFATLKKWFNDILLYFKSHFASDKDKRNEFELQRQLNKIADSILNGTYAAKYLNKMKDASNLRLVDFRGTLEAQTRKDGGRALNIIQTVNQTGAILTGSLAYRAQGTVYRKEQDTLHDLDFVVNTDSHSLFSDHPSLKTLVKFTENRAWTPEMLTEVVANTPYFRDLQSKIPGLQIMSAFPGSETITANCIICDNQQLVEKFMSLTGNFNARMDQLTQEERDSIYLVDLFFRKEDDTPTYNDGESGVTMADYTAPFKEKLKLGRAKDVFDYQMFDPTHRRYKVTPSTMYQKKGTKDVSGYTFYSGGAKGSDTAWSEEAEKLGITTKHYTPNDWNNLSDEWKNKLDTEYQEVVSMLGRKVLARDSYSGKLVRRDMMQADKADAIFAIGTVASNGYVDGGTGYATTRGIIRGIPVYLFDQADSKWKVWDNESKSFIETSMPKLTPNAATIGTRELKGNGRQAIKDILNKTVNQDTTDRSEETISINIETGDNAELSNFADRPIPLSSDVPHFKLSDTAQSILSYLAMASGAGYVAGNSSIPKFRSVETALQAIKAVAGLYFDDDFSNPYMESPAQDPHKVMGYDIPLWVSHVRAFTSLSPEEAQQKGKEIEKDSKYSTDPDKWEEVALELMKEFIYRSFKGNPSDLNKLFSTGNATLTSSRGERILDKEFPRILMEVREELMKEYNYTPQSPSVNSNKDSKKLEEAEETHNEILEVLGGGTEAESEIKDVVKTVKKGITFEEALKGVQTIFTEEEISQIKEAVAKTPEKRLHVMSVSRQTDPAFFSKQIVDFLKENSKKPLTDPTRVNVIEIWSKHDGLPIQDILEACKTYKVAPMVSFSITGLGDTALEKGVLKYTDLLPLIGKLISEGHLNPTTTTVRIDPILVGETNMEDIVKIVTEAKKLGIKKFVTSIVQSYGYLVGTAGDRKVVEGINKALAEDGRTYDWDKYYGRITQQDVNDSIAFKQNYLNLHPELRNIQLIKKLFKTLVSAASKQGLRYVTPNNIGKLHHIPKLEYVNEIGKTLIELNTDPEIELETCSFTIPGLKASACLDPLIIERLTGVDVTRPDGTYDRDTSRPECMCYGAHSDMFRFKEKTCASSCAYCYAAHSNDKSFRYYDDNGNLIPSRFTEVTAKSPASNMPTEQISPDFSLFESESKSPTEIQDEETTALVNEIDAVNESAVMTSTEVTKVAQKISYWISDKITEFAKNPELMFIKFPDKRTLDESGQWTEENKTKDIEKVKSMSRLSLIRFITPGNLLELCKMEFDKSTTLRTKKKVRFIKNNWNAIISLGSKTLAELEKVTFANDNASEVLTMEDPDFNSEDTTGGVQETQGNLQEQWQIETKTKDVISTMSQLVRLELRQCFELEEDGFNEDGSTKYKRVQDEFGMDERVEERTVVQSLLSWFRSVENIKDMISTLEGKVDKNPWVSQLLTKLKDTSGDNSDFQSQFFSTFYTAFQTYSVVNIDEDSGKYYTQIVNENPALKEVINSIKVLQKLGTLPIFNTTSVNSERLQELKDEYSSLLEILKKIKDRKLESLSAKDLKDATESIGYAAYLFGYTISPDIVKDLISYDSFNTIVNSLEQIVKHLEDSKNSKIFEPLVYKNEHSIISNLKSFLKPLVSHLEDITVESVHNDGKMYQSYVIPSYTSRLMDRFHLKGDRFKEFINNEYDTPWFKEPGTDFTRGWRNSWLRTLVNNPEARNIFKHKIALNFNKKNYMKNMTESEYLLSILTEYFSSDPKNGRALSWFRIPMQSNKPANEFIRFYSERGTNYREIITDGFYDIFLQELSRIQTVLMRDLNPSDPTYIKNFDKNGKKFCFLSYFNSELTSDSELGKLIQASIKGEKLSPEEIAKLEKLAKYKIKEEMNAKAEDILDRWEASGIIEAAKSVQGVNNSYAREDLENFIWNDTFAAMNILQLTITDIAYYKDAEDLQKRLAQLHAPGIRGNVFAIDYNGELVSADQKERVIYLKDFDSFKSNIIENIRVVFDRKIEQAPESEKAGLIALRDSLIKEPVLDEEGKEIERGGAYWYINIADAQAYNSITSYRKKAFIFGKWSRSAEEVYEKIKSNDYTYTELQAAFQPLKPFTYSQVQVSSGVDNAPLSKLKMGVQHKDSEYLLIMAGAILQGEDTGKPNLLRVINEIMEESADSNKGRGIDTVIFESGVKAGLTGVIDLSPYIDMPNGDKEAKAYLERILYNDTLYNPDYVQEIPFSDYSLQQEVPSHFAGHEQAHGSQIRYITPSDLVATDSFGNTVFYEVRGRKLTAKEFRKEYEETIAANIKESIELLIREFNLDSSDPKEKRKAISRLLVEEIRSNPRYGIDMLYACSIDPKTNDFRIPLGDPIQAKRVEQLLNSIVKNRVNKQEISGGPVVQVSNFGTSKELNIKFKSRSGKLLLTKKEFEQSNTTGYKTYEEYIKNEQAGIAYFEVYAPAYSKEIFTDFMDPDGTVDIKAIEALNPELLKMIGYRIPTEDKYSTLPLKIVGFLPKEAGEGIMMPNDITLITGSDFDIDKMYLMIKKLDIDPKSRKDISKSLWDKFSPKYKTFSEKNALRERINMFLDNPQIMKSADPEMWKAYKSVAYTVTEPKEGTRYDRDNKIIDMTYAVLTHETVADKILNPGNFEEQKKMGYIAVAKKITNYSYEELYAMDVEALKKICTVDKNLNFIDTHVQFYKQNSAAGSLIGTFAVHKVAHAILEGDSFYINALGAANSINPFTIAGFKFTDNMKIDPTKDSKGNLVGKTLGCLVASAVDAVKDPVLNLMNINSNTSSVLTTLIRLGMPFEEAALFMSQSCITDLISSFEMEKLANPSASLKKLISEILQIARESGRFSTDLEIEELTKEELINGLTGYSEELEYKVLSNLYKILSIADQIKTITYVTRLNSISNAVGPLVIDNLIMEHKLAQSSEFITKDGEPVTTIDVLEEHPILREFYRALGIAKDLLSDMPTNSTRFRSLISFDPAIEDILFSDRKLLSQLSDFYQSFCYVESGVINNNHLPNYIDAFPLYFISKNFKEQYKDNALIQAIKYTEEDGRLVLKVDTSGLNSTEKELLSSAWADLHKVNPKLSTQLFNYNFFRSGVGFSPKTFNNLLPSYVKARIEGYTKAFKSERLRDERFIMDLFIRHNWDNNKLVPWRSYKKIVDHIEGNILTVKEELAGLPGVNYFKMYFNKKVQMFRRTGENTFEIVEPLGNNGEYVEISLDKDYKAREVPKTALSKLRADEVVAKEVEEESAGDMLTDIEMQARAELILEIFSTNDTERTTATRIKEFRNRTEAEQAKAESAVKEFISKRLSALNIEQSAEYVEQLYNDLLTNENLCK